jgi:hypothetical protein
MPVTVRAEHMSCKIGCNDDRDIYFCLTGNSGAGIFNKDWIALEEIDSLLATEKGPITSGSLKELFDGKSSNSAGFVLAVILSEGLLKISSNNERHYERIDPKEYRKIIQAYNKKKTVKKGKGVTK